MGLTGIPTPRISTTPAGDPTRGEEAAAFIYNDLGVVLLDWQRHVLDGIFRTDPETGKLVYRTCCVTVARQQGKTHLAACRAIAGMCLFDERTIISASQSRGIALEQFRLVLELVEEAGIGIDKVRWANGAEEVKLENGARYKVVASTPGSARGLTADAVIMDEVREYKTFDTWASLERTRRARPNSQVMAISTEGDLGSVVLAHLQKTGRAYAETGEQGDMLYMEWSAAPWRAPEDREGWREANPALGILLDEQTIASEQRTDPPEVFERETLCRRTTVTTPWIPDNTWAQTTDPLASVPDGADGEVCFGIDVAPDLMHGSITVAWVRDDSRTHVEAIDSYDGPAAAASLEARLLDLCSRWKPRCVAALTHGSADAIATRAGRTGIKTLSVSDARMAAASRSFHDSVQTGRIVHPPDPVLAAHVGATAAGATAGVASTARNPSAPNDAALAAVLAVYASERSPAPEPKASWVAW